MFDNLENNKSDRQGNNHILHDNFVSTRVNRTDSLMNTRLAAMFVMVSQDDIESLNLKKGDDLQ